MGKKSKFGARYLRIGGKVVMNPRLIANEIGNKFKNNSSNANCSANFLNRKENIETTSPNFSNNDLNVNVEYNRPFELFELDAVLKNIKGTSAGPDQIRYEMIKNLNKPERIIILEYFNNIWISRTFPNQWHEATIIPILKPGKDSLEPDSYRPIALTNCLCKILERLVNNRLLHVLEKEQMICKFQSGFRKKRCTYDNVTRLENDIKSAFTVQSSVLAVFLDLQKAYDMAWRRGILQKLYDLGFRGNLPIFINNLMTDRTFKVRIGTELSDTFTQINGVPQGSVISPTLFMILINDMLKDISPNVKFALYADDIVLWCDLKDADDARIEMQKALDKLSEWQEKWGTSFSPIKSNYVVFSRKRIIPKVKLTINEVEIPQTDTTFFLGLKFDRKLRWHEHINYLITACNKRLNVLRSIQNSNWGADRYSLIAIYKSFIRAKLDYGSHLYDAAAKGLKNKLNVIQNSALRLATGALRNSNQKTRS